MPDFNLKYYDKPCKCGSGKLRYPLEDARCIFVDYVCDDCKTKVMAKYRPEIFTDSGYDTMGEQVEEDE